MLIDQDLLYSYGAEDEHHQPGDIIFSEGQTPVSYYQISTGRIKLNHYNEDGKELILAILHSGLSVCELLLFIDKKYPVNAVVLEPSHTIKLPKSNFLKMLDDHPGVAKKVNKFLAERLYHKFIMLENNSSLNPEVRIKGVLDYQKSFVEEVQKYSYEVPLTRQQLASMTGLRVETVIRTIKNIEKSGVLQIVNGKIYY
jgi:CRP-like cAMP-binding protein